MARALIVGCGCRGRELGGELVGRGWRVRGTTRNRGTLALIEGAEIEPASGDPDRPGTILDLCGDVSVVVWLLASASGTPDAVSAIHGPRLERLLEKLVESPVRGFAYEVTGTVDADTLESGRGIVERAGERWRIPVALLNRERGEPGWARSTAAEVAGLLA